ncbi:hypothetical protein [Bdellovibrio bacteriovorus]|uniref:hypothetical protein n=1 Tax=Bdellovibrio bacteriovorus TaxID=959 RepID=UPI0035A860B6
MKKLIAVLLVLSAAPASYAGKMKEIWWMTNESVLETLGFDEGTVAIENHKFVQVEGADLAIQTTVRGFYRVNGSVPTYQCVTAFVKTNDFYDVLKTECK